MAIYKAKFISGDPTDGSKDFQIIFELYRDGVLLSKYVDASQGSGFVPAYTYDESKKEIYIKSEDYFYSSFGGLWGNEGTKYNLPVNDIDKGVKINIEGYVFPEKPANPPAASPTGDIKVFIDAFNAELEKVYTKATTDLGPWKKAREEAIKITKLRMGTWPVDPTVKTIGDLFAYVFFDPDGVNYKTPPYFIISNGVSAYVDGALEQQYGDWIDDMNGVSVSDPSIGVIFKSLSWPYNNNNWKGNDRKSTRPIVLSDSANIIQNYNEIKKPGITNPDKYSAGQYWFDMFMSEVVGLNGLQGYLKSSKFVDDYPPYKGLHITWGTNNSRIEEIFSEDLLNNNQKIEKSFSYWGNVGSDGAGNSTYSDPVYEDRKVYTMSVSKFASNETIFGASTGLILTTPHKYDRDNYSDYGTDEYPAAEGFAKILDKIRGGGYQGFDIRNFDALKTQYRPGINSLESLSKDPLFNPIRTNFGDGPGEVDWSLAGTQSLASGVYWEYPVGTTASVVGNFELISLYKAFLQAGDDYKTITIPKYEPEPKVEPPVVSTLVPTTESKLSGEFTFNVEKKDTFVVVGNQNFALKIGDLVIEGLTTSTTPVIESPKTIDLGDGIVIIDDGELGEDIYIEESFQGGEEQSIFSFDKIDYTVTIDTDELNSIKGFDPENPDENLSTDSTNKYPVSKDKDANAKAIIKAAKSLGVTNKFAITGILAVVSKESGFVPRSEASYAGTSGARIIKIFGSKGKTAAEWDVIKKDAVKFFDLIYGGKYGNAKNEGYKYRGRGFNQITFKGNYEQYSKDTGLNLVADPDLLNTVDAAAKCVVAYFKRNIKNASSGIKSQYHFSDINSFTNLNDATGAMYHANAGWGKKYSEIIADSTGGRKKAFGNAGPLFNTYSSQIA